jgi:DNA-binding beta-propeller fold protein YncE
MLRRASFAIACAVAACFLGTGDGGPKSTASARPPACARRGPLRITPLDVQRVGSTVALARFGDRTVAYVADEDDRDLHTFDVDGARELVTTPLHGAPSQLLVTRDGRVVVALRDRAALEVLEPHVYPEEPLDERCAVETPDEPVALAMTPDDATLLVSSGWGHRISALAGETLAPVFERTLAREPRGVVVSDDGKQAFVTHAVGGKMSVVDLAAPHAVRSVDMGEHGDLRSPERVALVPRERTFDENGNLKKPKPITEATPRAACQGFALARTFEPSGRVLAPEVLVDTGDHEASPRGYGNAGALPTEMATVAVVDTATGEPVEASLTVQLGVQIGDKGDGRKECLLPRAAAVDAVSGTLLVACLGLDAVVAYDAAAAQPVNAEVRRWEVPGGPTGIAVDTVGRKAVVWAQFDRAVDILGLGDPLFEQSTTVRVSLSRQATPASEHDLAMGRRLFHTGIARDGRACASCHPDGRDDSLVWSTPDGTRQTPTLVGRLEGTAPYGWNGTSATLEQHLASTFSRLNASALDGRQAEALLAYVMQLPAPAAPSRAGSPDEIARGREIFHGAEAACSSCHGMDGHSPDGLKHTVVGTGEFDTPSLRFVSGTAPYFHDGKYASLEDMLAATDGAMGKTGQLSPEDRRALETYLRSL